MKHKFKMSVDEFFRQFPEYYERCSDVLSSFSSDDEVILHINEGQIYCEFIFHRELRGAI